MDDVFVNTAAGVRAENDSTPFPGLRTFSHDSSIVVAGVGSPYGDDQVGWKVVEMLQQVGRLGGRCVQVREGSDLVVYLAGCRRLIVIDACQSGSSIGTLTQMRWPDPRIVENSCGAMHGFTLCEALELAASLDRMPTSVEVFAIEIGDCTASKELSPPVREAACAVCHLVAHELSEEAYA